MKDILLNNELFSFGDFTEILDEQSVHVELDGMIVLLNAQEYGFDTVQGLIDFLNT